jgi:mono/diheme cytochrome c family protein
LVLAIPVAAVIAFTAGCGDSLPRVTPDLVATAQRTDPAADAPRLDAGRSCFVARCGACHGLPDPHGFAVPEWQSWMARMAPKAKLDPDQTQAVLDYVLAAREH